jgi:acyl dehydratase
MRAVMPLRSSPLAVNVADLAEHVGASLGVSAWHRIDQTDVDAFAELTRDRQWIHVDAARVQTEGMAGTIVHGFLTLALIPSFVREAVQITGWSKGLNYGLDRVRFSAPVPTGARVRGHVQLAAVSPIPNGYDVKLLVSVEADGVPKPVCVANTIVRYFS